MHLTHQVEGRPACVASRPGGTSGHGRPLKSLLQYAEQTKATDSEANGENRTSR